MTVRTQTCPRAATPVGLLRWHGVVRLDELAVNVPLAVRIDGRAIVLVRTDDGVHALDDRCSHQDVALSAGDVCDGTLECCLHGSQFDLITGEALCPPASHPVAVHPVEIRDGVVCVGLSRHSACG